MARWLAWFENTRSDGKTAAEQVRRGDVVDFPETFTAEAQVVQDEVLYRIRYKGYLEREYRQVERLAEADRIKIPDGFRYEGLPGLRAECAQKLSKIRPLTLGQAGRISGVNPADVSVLMVALIGGRRRSALAAPGSLEG